MRSYQAVRMEWWHEDDDGVGRSCTDVAEVERLHRGARGGARASNDAEPLNASHADINSMSLAFESSNLHERQQEDERSQ